MRRTEGSFRTITDRPIVRANDVNPFIFESFGASRPIPGQPATFTNSSHLRHKDMHMVRTFATLNLTRDQEDSVSPFLRGSLSRVVLGYAIHFFG